MLYDSLHGKLLTLPDSVEVYPAHGAGSLCGRNISSETTSTIGQQRQFNYALRPMPREEFVRMMTTDLPEAPAYFSRDVAINREGPANLSELPEPPALDARGRRGRCRRTGAVVLDTRPAAQYGAGHVPGSLHIGLSRPVRVLGRSADPAADADRPRRRGRGAGREARTRLARVGLENVAGYLAGGILAWHDAGRPARRRPSRSASTSSMHRLARGPRSASSWTCAGRESGRRVTSRRPGNVPLNKLAERAAELDRRTSRSRPSAPAATAPRSRRASSSSRASRGSQRRRRHGGLESSQVRDSCIEGCPGRGARSLPEGRSLAPRERSVCAGSGERSRPHPAESLAGAPEGADPAQARSDGPTQVEARRDARGL